MVFDFSWIMQGHAIWDPLNKIATLRKYQKTWPTYMQIQTNDLLDNIVYKSTMIIIINYTVYQVIWWRNEEAWAQKF